MYGGHGGVPDQNGPPPLAMQIIQRGSDWQIHELPSRYIGVRTLSFGVQNTS